MAPRICETCGTELARKPNERVPAWERRKYCGNSCWHRARSVPPSWLPSALDLREKGVPNHEIIAQLGLDLGTTGLNAWFRKAGAPIHGVPAEQRFWKKVDKGDGPDACWHWTASRSDFGHGQFVPVAGESPWRAHRFSWTLAHGPIPDGLCVRHRCDNPSCVNPAHLDLGTLLDNARDMVERKRNHLGSARPESKLTEERVLDARRRAAAGESHRSIAADFGVTSGAIAQAVAGKTWRHVGEAA